MFIDAHVHLRDEEQSSKETIAHGLWVAKNAGVKAVFDMPNTTRPVMTEERVRARLFLASQADVPEIFYGIYIGLSNNPEQVKQAVNVYRKFFPKVVGMKLYAGHSVGNLGVIQEASQQMIYQTLASEGYEGVLAVHCEKECTLEAHKHIWNPHHPHTHCLARPEQAEVESVKDQLAFAFAAGFKGKLHIAHISSPRAVELVVAAKQNGMDVSSGICPHHFIYDWNQMEQDKGLFWKMNPALRSPESKNEMFQFLRDGKIDWIETDHAPHTLKEKFDDPYMSGIPGLPWWPLFAEYLKRQNFSDNQIEKLTFSNIVDRFGIEIKKSRSHIENMTDEYPFNPYENMGIEIKWK